MCYALNCLINDLFKILLNYGKTIVFADIDECSGNTDNCHAQATCTNTIGNFTCACNEGYEGDGVTCTGDVLKAQVIFRTGTFVIKNFYKINNCLVQ